MIDAHQPIPAAIEARRPREDCPDLRCGEFPRRAVQTSPQVGMPRRVIEFIAKTVLRARTFVLREVGSPTL